MNRLPSVMGRRLMEASGFAVVRVRGSHYFRNHADGRSTIVPVYSGETIRRGPSFATPK